MSSTVILSAEEVERLTNYKRPADQLRELHRMGYFRARRGRVTGEVILERAHVEAVAAGQVAVPVGAARNRPKLRIAS